VTNPDDARREQPTVSSGGVVERAGGVHPGVRVGFIVLVAVIVGSIVYAIAGTAGTTDSQRPTGGGDSRTDLGVGVSAVVQTVDKAVVQVKIREIADEGFGFAATVAGIPEGETGRWTAVLDDGSEIEMAATLEPRSVVRATLPGGVPAGRSVDEVVFDPDASDGEIHFEVH
jgi:hypothetical protein